MKGSILNFMWWHRVRALRCLIVGLLVSASGTAFALEHVISKTGAPGAVLVLSNSNTSPSVGFSSFSILSSDIPSGTFINPKQLLEIQWRTTYYPDSISQEVELCYSRPYSTEEHCVGIRPNSSGTVYNFNNQTFGHGAAVRIKHLLLGGTPPYTRPAGLDSVTFRYSY